MSFLNMIAESDTKLNPQSLQFIDSAKHQVYWLISFAVACAQRCGTENNMCHLTEEKSSMR